MSPFLSEIIADPSSGDKLDLINDEYFINVSTGQKFPVQNGIPNLLIQSSNSLDSTTESSVGFNYRDHYEKDAILVDYSQADEALVTRNERKRNRQAIIHEVPASAGLILDVGCGGAWVAETFLPQNKQVISMDISSANPARAREKFPQSNHQAIIADAMFLPFRDNSFDCIIASEVIEHVEHPTIFIERLLKKIKPGGRLILMTPYNEKIRYHLCIHCNTPTPQNGHLHSFTEEKMISLVASTKADSKTDAFCNNYLLKLRFYNLLAFLPFPVWKTIDGVANAIARKPLSLLTVFTKK